jgi:NTP pyrophosphatase (non-canonical NTP hydrolase)
MTLDTLQYKLADWQRYNFPRQVADRERLALLLALGVSEESGELAHAVLKRDQGIRGTDAEHKAKIRDAIGDIAIFAMQLCTLEGWSFESIVTETAAEVMKRKWEPK